MKISHTYSKNLSSKETLDQSKAISNSLYKIDPKIGSIYDIHVNLVDGDWFIDFIASGDYPELKVNAYTENKSSYTILKIDSISLTNVPKTIKFDDNAENLNDYLMILEYISELYDYEFTID